MQEGDHEGVIPFVVDFVDIAGNTGGTVTEGQVTGQNVTFGNGFFSLLFLFHLPVVFCQIAPHQSF
jgi:hypothetical protein